jgi:hypothetical protein
VFTPSDITVIEQVLGSDTVSILQLHHEGIAFVKKPNYPYIRDIFVFPQDSTLNFGNFNYDKHFLAKLSKQMTKDGVTILRLPSCYIR